MKSMEQMQREIIAKARWDGGWPRAVHVGMGIVALARNKDEYDRLRRHNRIVWAFAIPTGLAVAIIIQTIAMWHVGS